MDSISDSFAEVLPQGRAGIYHYNEYDREFLQDRVGEFRDQVARRLSGDLTEDEFKPLRLMNGLYLQLHAYMLRIAVPYGVLSSDQMRKLAEVAERYDRGYGHFTTRQNLQLNWLGLEDAPDALALLAEADLHALQTSGNCIRNVTTDEYAGAAADEVVDPRIAAEIIRQWSTRHPEFSYLPRKFKIAITGAAADRAAVQVHDIGLEAKRAADGTIGYAVHVGGGLGRVPIVGTKLRDFVPEADLLSYLEAVLRVYNAHGGRENIHKARIKILLRDLGAARFAELVDEEFAAMPRARYRLEPELVAEIAAHFGPPAFLDLPEAEIVLSSQRAAEPGFDRFVARNTSPHRAPGYISVLVSLKPIGGIPGDATAAQMQALADLADRYSCSELRVTHAQNIVLAHVRQDQLHALWRELGRHGLDTPNGLLITDTITCPGLDYCALANARAIPVAQRISERFADLDRQFDIGTLHINISGCINACGHHHVGHIGILGVDKKGVEYYQITLGGSATNDAAIGEILGPAFSYDDVVDAIERIVQVYLDRREAGEEFKYAVRRLGLTPFQEALYGTA
jgi:sulfite reductase (NADPH) hemoprotein beta-component